jgi:tRNA dimethylallyltransferase
MAAAIIDRILSHGKRVLIVGGTGLYLKALTEGLCDAPPADVRIREQLWSECHGQGSHILYNRLQGVDAAAAARIHPNDARRIIRALEVFALTGRPISAWWRQATAELLHGQVMVVGVNRDRAELYQRINTRVLNMLYEQGVINEVRELLRTPVSRAARQVHGLADIERYLSGSSSLKDMIGVWQQRVRHYARRQLIWFRQTPNIQWVNISKDEHPWETTERLLDLVRRRQTLPAGVDE